MIKRKLDILIVEDVPVDADAIEAELKDQGIRFISRRVDTSQGYLAALNERMPDIVLSDFTLPQFDALTALQLLKRINDDMPFILVTGARSEEVAVECIRAGADDYILKSSLKRLGASIRNAIQKKAAEREKKLNEQTLRKLPQQIREAQEAERRRVARELHDGVIQILSSIRFRSQALEEALSGQSQDIRQEAARISGLLEKSIQEVRSISHNLLPSELYDLGLSAAVRDLVEEFKDRNGWTVLWKMEALTDSNWPKDINLNLYRIIQEALTNTEKHAQADRVEVILKELDSQLELVIQDNGLGIADGARQVASSGIGLTDIRERTSGLGGTFALETKPDAGLKLHLTIPLPCS